MAKIVLPKPSPVCFRKMNSNKGINDMARVLNKE
jgi:hypothetical protein